MKKFVLIVLLAFLFLVLSFNAEPQPAQCTSSTYYSLYGYVQNSTYNYVNASNVTLYRFTETPGQPPSEAYENSALTNASGFFNVTVSGSCSLSWKVKVYSSYSSGNVLEVSPILPPLPRTAFDMGMKGGTFYLQPAATLKLYAVNTSDLNTPFSYVVFDEILGMPVGEGMQQLYDTASVTVPNNRNYTILFMRTPELVGGFNNAPTPPLTYKLNNLSNYSSAEYVVLINKSLAYSYYNVTGYINVSGNSSFVNVTNIIVKITSGGLVPSGGKMSLPNGVTINYNVNAEGQIASYTLLMLGASSPGIDYALEFYGNSSSAYFGAFQNVTVLTDNVTQLNVSLTRLAGSYMTSTDINTSMVNVSLTDNTGTALTDAHIELTFDVNGSLNPQASRQLRYFVDSLSNGAFWQPFPLNSNVSVKIFSNRFAPLEKKLNLSNASNTINLQLKPFDMKKMSGNGSKMDFGQGDMRVRFMKNNVACNVFDPDVTSCRLGSTDFDAGFNPLMAMMAGKANLRIEVGNGTGSILYYIGVDMLASGPPDAGMSESANYGTNSSGIAQEVWRFGSMSPDIYDAVLVGIPYNDSKFNESRQINVTITALYDNDGRAVWSSQTYTSAQNIPPEWSDYNVTWFNATAGGMPCGNTGGYRNFTNATCFVNTTSNYIWLKLPHFTDGNDSVGGDSESVPPTIAVTRPSNKANESIHIKLWINGTCTDSSGANYSWVNDSTFTNIGTAANFNFTNASAFLEKNYSVNISCDDVYGNVARYVLNFTYDITRPTTNASITAINDSDWDGNINFSFDLANEDAATYMVFRWSQHINSSSIGNATNIYNTSNSALTLFQDNTSSSSTNYYYALVTIDAAGNYNRSVVSNSINATANDTVVPKAPTNLSISASGSTATLTWLAVERDINNSADLTGIQYKLWTGLSVNTTNSTLVNNTGSGLSLYKTVSTNTTTFTSSATETRYFAITSIDDGGNQNNSLVPNGTVKNFGSVSLNYTSSDTSGGSSGGGGGGGGGTPTAELAGIKYAKVWSTISADAVVEMEINKEGIDLTKISFVAKSTKNNVEISVTKLQDEPDVGTPDNTVYQYIYINKENIEDENLSDLRVRFRIEKKWLNSNNADYEDVRLLRFQDDEWKELSPLMTSTDELYYHFSVDLPGLSYFAIALKKAEEKKAEIPALGGNDTTNISQTVAKKKEAETRAVLDKLKIIAMVIVAIIVLLILVYAGYRIIARPKKLLVISKKIGLPKHAEEGSGEIEKKYEEALGEGVVFEDKKPKEKF